MPRTQTLATLIALAALATTPAHAVVWSVAADGSGDVPTIDAALSVASDGDVVELGAGTYFESGLTLTDGVVLRSASGIPQDVIIDARGSGRVLSVVSVNTGTAIEGVTITGGSAQPPCADPGAGRYCLAGGLLLLDATIDVRRCVFVRNHATDNGGAVSSVLSAANFLECEFERNTATHGGAISFVSSERLGESPSLDRCVFRDNEAVADAGAVYSYQSNPGFVRCTFRENRCGQQGSAIFWQSGASAMLDRTLIVSGVGQSPFFCGVDSALPTLLCCDVWNNAGGDWVNCLAPQASRNGNFSADPLFCGPQSADIHESSPCAPGSATACGAVGAGEVACHGPTSMAPSTWSQLKASFRR